MLFIDDGQTQTLKVHIILKQGVGADGHACATVENGGLGIKARLALELAREPGNVDFEGCEPLLERAVVLLGEDLGGGHHGHLIVAGNGCQRGHGGYHCLAGADITLHQAQHGHFTGQVSADFINYATLGTGQREGQLSEKPSLQAASTGEGRCTVLLNLLAYLLQAETMSEQFL